MDFSTEKKRRINEVEQVKEQIKAQFSSEITYLNLLTNTLRARGRTQANLTKEIENKNKSLVERLRELESQHNFLQKRTKVLESQNTELNDKLRATDQAYRDRSPLRRTEDRQRSRSPHKGVQNRVHLPLTQDNRDLVIQQPAGSIQSAAPLISVDALVHELMPGKNLIQKLAKSNLYKFRHRIRGGKYQLFAVVNVGKNTETTGLSFFISSSEQDSVRQLRHLLGELESFREQARAPQLCAMHCRGQ